MDLPVPCILRLRSGIQDVQIEGEGCGAGPGWESDDFGRNPSTLLRLECS